MRLSELVAQLDLAIAQTSLVHQQTLDPEFEAVAAIEEAVPGALSFVDSAKFAPWVEQTSASILILPPDPALQQRAIARGIAWIASEQPRTLFAQVLALVYQPWPLPLGVHPTASVDPSVQLGHGVAIGAYVTIQPGVVLGDGVCIHPHGVIYPEVIIGDRTIIHANCTLHERTVIGKDCVLHSGVVIGDDGFGFVPTEQGWVKMPQSGRVVLEDGVDVGSNSTVDRPAVGETRIGEGTKIDNLVQIGHGCQIGAHSLICAQVGLAGATILGKNVVLAGQVGAAGHLTIGDRAIVGAQSGIHQDVPAGARMSGYPAMEQRLWLRAMAAIKKLPELVQRLKQLEQKVSD